MPLKLTNTNAAYNGHTVPFADLRSGRAYGGHTVPFAPTAFPTEAREKLPNRRPSFCIRSEKEKHGI